MMENNLICISEKGIMNIILQLLAGFIGGCLFVICRIVFQRWDKKNQKDAQDG